jgi:site-specific DNA recombinase
MKTAALYARFSSDLQKDRSIDDQLAICRQYAEREGLKVVATFTDRAKSGASLFDRDGLIDLVARAKERGFDAVIVESLDRLSRDQEDLAGLFKRLSFHGAEILTVNEGKTTSIHVGIRGLVGSLYLADLGAKVRRGHAGQVREGKIPGAVTYGYDMIAGKPGERAINEPQAKIIRRIFAEYASGRSPRAIALDLTRQGIVPPGGGKSWHCQTFVGGRLKRGMIGNPLYAGRLIWNASRNVLNPDTGAKLKRAGKPEDFMEIAVPHLRIVDEALWLAANEMRRGRAVTRFGRTGKVGRRPVVARTEHLLAGLLRCGICGGHMRIAQQSRGGAPRVACATAHQHSACEHRKTYDLDVLQTAVLDQMRARLTDPAMIAEAAKAFHERWAENNKKARLDQSEVKRELNRIQVKIDRLVDAIENSNQPVKALMAKLNPLDIERAGLTERLRLLEVENNVIDLHPGAIEAYRKNVEKLHEAFARNAMTNENRAAFRNLIDSIVVHQTAKRAPYEFTPYGRLGAILGIDLFPTIRRDEEILAEQGVSCSDNGNPENPGLPISLQRNVICFGRWKVAA